MTVPRQNARRQCMNATMDECDVVERRGLEDKCDLVHATVPTVRQCKSVPGRMQHAVKYNQHGPSKFRALKAAAAFRPLGFQVETRVSITGKLVRDEV